MSLVLQYVAAIGPFVLAGVAWLLREYISRRVSEAARGAVDLSVGKTLAEHSHQLDFERARRSRDYELFAERRNVVYAKAFTRFERARGAFQSRLGHVTMTTKFDGSPRADLEALANKLELISDGERADLRLAIISDLSRAGLLATDLYEKHILRYALQQFEAFKGTVVLNALYFSPYVDELLDNCIKAMAPLAVAAESVQAGPLEFRERREVAEKAEALDSLLAQLKSAMQVEIRAGVDLQALPTKT